MNKKAMIAAGLIAGAAALTGCAAMNAPTATQSPQAMQQETAQPQSSPSESTLETAEETESPGPLLLRVGDTEIEPGAVTENGELLLPLEATGEALGWKAESEETQEETQTKRVISLEKEESRITVAYTVSDNTAKGITWQKDGLLIPVDARLTSIDGTVYVPAAFFEKAMDVSVSHTEKGVRIEAKTPKETPGTQEQTTGEND